ncbi:hypothetical protein DQ04_02061050 [Trypanosoma grayi]|uniref:hypothetical protein n=1 Tax=Trypanosoma grayi TaxID=71804 RepID=UPI0004F46986|nr:hypothetical protein DQ04_02061050 [Trypanosoma grayi]KEG12028.1 hypothetical protein DQ04_02061050 [Trypanosoma grayi]
MSHRSLRVRRLTMIESAEDVSLWLKRAHEQWCTNDLIAIRIKNSNDIAIGCTVPLPFEHHTRNGNWWGLNWDAAGEATSVEDGACSGQSFSEGGFTFTVSEEPSTLLAVDAITLTGKVVGVGVLDIQSAFVEDRMVQWYRVSLVPKCCAVDDATVHAVLEVEVTHNEIATRESGKSEYLLHDIPTSIHCDVVDVSTTQFLFPTCFLTGTGAFVVSNVLCVKNITTDMVSVQLAVTGNSSCVRVQPPGKVVLKEGEKAYFVATWDVFKKFAASTKEGVPIEMHVMLVAGGEELRPVAIQMFGETPRASATNAAFHYWVNTTMITNRPCAAEELTLLKTMLPVFQVGKSE